MKLFLTDSTNPFYNLACEEYFLRYSEEDVFMLWQNEPSVIIGKNQNMYAEVDLEYTEPRGIHVSRRITGGGAVYHDLGNVNYSFITSREKANVLDFAYFTAPIIKALKTLGVEAVLSGRNDLLATFPDGSTAKFSGNAETATKTRVLHHGTLLFDSDLSVLSKTLKPDPLKLKSKAISSVRSRVTNLKPLVDREMDTKGFLEYLISFSEKEWNTTREVADPTEILATGLYDRNRSEDYNAGRKKEYEFRAKKKFDAGIVMVLWNEKEGRISEFFIEGDYFGDKDTAELCPLFTGAETTEKGLREALFPVNVSEYIDGVTNEAFTVLVLSGK